MFHITATQLQQLQQLGNIRRTAEYNRILDDMGREIARRIMPWAVFVRIAEGTGRQNWRFVSQHESAHAAAVEARRLWESVGIEHCASGND